MNASPDHPLTAIRTADLHDPQECARIDAFVDAKDGSTPFHRTAWSIAIARGCGAKAHYLVAEGVSGIVGVLPLHEVRSPLFGNALVSAGFAVDGGVLGDDAGLVNAMMAFARQSGCGTVELRGGAMPDTDWKIDAATYLGFVRPLAGDDEAQLQAIPRKQRAEVRRALGFGLDVRVGHDPEDVDAHYRVYAESVRNLGTPVFPRALFREVLAAFGADADILAVSHQGRPLASVLSLYHKGIVYPYWGGGVADARAWRANDMMYYALMLHARREKGCTLFDFGRSKAGTGPAAFKKNWGFEGTPLHYAKRSTDGQPVRDVNPLSPKYRFQVATWQKLPLPIANLVGPWISRGLG